MNRRERYLHLQMTFNHKLKYCLRANLPNYRVSLLTARVHTSISLESVRKSKHCARALGRAIPTYEGQTGVPRALAGGRRASDSYAYVLLAVTEHGGWMIIGEFPQDVRDLFVQPLVEYVRVLPHESLTSWHKPRDGRPGKKRQTRKLVNFI